MKTQFDEYTTIRDAAMSSPAARGVIEKYFGKDCFQCPSFPGEPLFMGARMHAVDLELLLSELNTAAS